MFIIIIIIIDRLKSDPTCLPIASSIYLSILLFKGLLLFGFLIFMFKNAPISLCLSRDKTKGQSGKNTTLTPTKILPKK